MAVKIRLSRRGKKKLPSYRIVATDSRNKRDGAFLDDLGTYDAINGKIVRFEKDRIDSWVEKGAIPTDAVEKLRKNYAKNGGNVKKVTTKKKAVAAKKSEDVVSGA